MNIDRIRNEAKDKRKIYILRRVGFVFIVICLILALFLIIFNNNEDIPVVENGDFSPSAFNIIITDPPKTPEPTPEPIKILIYQTHNDEAYYKGNKKYEETDTGRTLNEKYNVIAVGEELKNNLEKYGFYVVHDKSDNVSDGFNEAYDTSLKNIKKYGEFDVYIDLHRDAYYPTNNNYIKQNNTEYAFIRFVVANGTKYKEKPNYKTNVEFATKINEKINSYVNNIGKEIFEKNARLNQHLSDKCLLIEIGNERNDIQQVKNSTKLIARAISEIL